MAFIVNHLVYEQVCEKIFGRPHFLVGGVCAKPLAHDIGTSIVPVREALIRLAQQDALDNIPSKGFFIPPLRAPHVGGAFNIARQLLRKQDRSAIKQNKTEVEALVAQNPILSWHWIAFDNLKAPSTFSPLGKGQYADFDQKFLALASKNMAEADWQIMRYIWGQTIHYRYFVYGNFDLYIAPELGSLSHNGDDVVSFVDDVFRRYASLAENAGRLASADQRPSPYM